MHAIQEELVMNDGELHMAQALCLRLYIEFKLLCQHQLSVFKAWAYFFGVMMM